MNSEFLAVLNVLVLIGAITAAFVAVEAKRMLDSIIALGASGSFMAVEFLFLQAPDVAIAEAAVGAVLGTVLYIIALRKVMGTNREDEK